MEVGVTEGLPRGEAVEVDVMVTPRYRVSVGEVLEEEVPVGYKSVPVGV